jgi:hypothetical protein
MGAVAVELDGVIQQVVLVARLRRVVGECPVDEILDRTDESEVITDGVVVIRRPWKCALTPVRPTCVTLYAVVYPPGQSAVGAARASRRLS